MVMVLSFQTGFTPAGKPVGDPMPVAPEVIWVMTGLSAVLTHRMGVEEGAPADIAGVTVMVPVAVAEPHPPVSGIE